MKTSNTLKLGPRILLPALLGSFLVCPIVSDAAEAQSVRELRELSLEELMNIEVTSVSKKEQKLTQTSAAIAVLTSEDIRRSGVTHFQDALRLVPGVEVAQIGSQNWAISVRGFNDMFANKLLVMIDGRSVYTPLFSGVFWDVQDMVLEDIDRIEVIRGPGASVWGANAVNGVINIISKKAKETQGGLVSIGGGNLEPFVGTVRQGFQLSENSWMRWYGKLRFHQPTTLANGTSAADESFFGQTGFRTDWESSDSVMWTLQGDGYYGNLDQTQYFPELQPPFSSTLEDTAKPFGANLLGRWTKQLDVDSELSLQTWLDYLHRENSYFKNDQIAGDIDLNYRKLVADKHDISMGIDFRVTSDDIRTSDIILQADNQSETHILASYYIQDEWEINPETVHLTLGSKFEYNDFTGMEIQPTARIAWTPNENHTLWGSVSRAVRTPSRAEDGFSIVESVLPPGSVNPVLPGLVTFVGNENFDAEDLLAYELGYRVQPTSDLSFDLALFFNDYDNLRGFVAGTPYPQPSPPSIIVPLDAANDTSGFTYGAELASRWQATDWWQWRISYNHLRMDLEGSTANISGKSPRNQFSVQSLINLPQNIELDSVVRYVGELPDLNIPSYITLDVRIGWNPRDDLEVYISGRNLIDSPHQEFAPTFLPFAAGLVERSVFLGVRWAF